MPHDSDPPFSGMEPRSANHQERGVDVGTIRCGNAKLQDYCGYELMSTKANRFMGFSGSREGVNPRWEAKTAWEHETRTERKGICLWLK